MSGSGISWDMQVCTSLQTDNYANTPPLSHSGTIAKNIRGKIFPTHTVYDVARLWDREWLTQKIWAHFPGKSRHRANCWDDSLQQERSTVHVQREITSVHKNITTNQTPLLIERRRQNRNKTAIRTLAENHKSSMTTFIFKALSTKLTFIYHSTKTSGGWEGRDEGGSAPGGTVQGQHLEGQKYGILKFGHFWQIGVCIAEWNLHYVIITPPNLAYCSLQSAPMPSS